MSGREEIIERVDLGYVTRGELVRCGRCKWWKCNPNTTKYGACKKVSYDDFEVVMESDDFCSYGEHKGGDDDID